MRRKHLILASCIISALLLTFTFHVSADENVEADSGASSNSAPYLDSYFWDNYTLLPYIESSGQQYIDTGITANSNLTVKAKFTPLDEIDSQYRCLFGVREDPSINYFYFVYKLEEGTLAYSFGVNTSYYTYTANQYSIYDVTLAQRSYFNDHFIREFDDEFSGNSNIYIFARNSSGYPQNYSKSRIYSFSIYDSSLNDPSDEDSGEVGYLRYYYPARSISGDVIGLYDAVSKTFVTTGSNTPFANPTGSAASMGITANITNFLVNGVSWITDILEFAIEEPIILMFMAIGLCGVAFRWARRVVHF